MSVCSKFFYSIKKFFQNAILDIKNTMPFVVTCGTIDPRFKEYAIASTHKEIMTMIDKLNDELNKDEKWESNQNIRGERSKISQRKIMINTFNKIYGNIVKYNDKQLNNIYEKKNKKWSNWCDDVVLYHCYNRVLNERLIPTILQ